MQSAFETTTRNTWIYILQWPWRVLKAQGHGRKVNSLFDVTRIYLHEQNRPSFALHYMQSFWIRQGEPKKSIALTDDICSKYSTNYKNLCCSNVTSNVWLPCPYSIFLSSVSSLQVQYFGTKCLPNFREYETIFSRWFSPLRITIIPAGSCTSTDNAMLILESRCFRSITERKSFQGLVGCGSSVHLALSGGRAIEKQFFCRKNPWRRSSEGQNRHFCANEQSKRSWWPQIAS